MFNKFLLAILLSLRILSVSHAQTDNEETFPAVVGRIGSVQVYYVHDGITEVVFDKSSIANPSGPWWSSDGQFFAISTWIGHDSQQLMQFDAQTGEAVPRIALGWETPNPSPDFSYVAYENVHSDRHVLNVASMDGAELVAIEAVPIDTVAHFVAWSPDNEWLLFSAESQLYRIRADGTEKSAVTPHDVKLADNHSVVWSPDGELIAFAGITEENNEPDIYIVRADGTELTQLTTDPVLETQPAWSPDGASIAFVAVGEPTEDHSFVRNLFTIDVDGSNLTQVTTEDYVSNPYWSTDWIIFSDVTSFAIGCEWYCAGVITAIKPDGTARTPLTDKDVHLESFAVAPNVIESD